MRVPGAAAELVGRAAGYLILIMIFVGIGMATRNRRYKNKKSA